jgi:hypothetical protein
VYGVQFKPFTQVLSNGEARVARNGHSGISASSVWDNQVYTICVERMDRAYSVIPAGCIQTVYHCCSIFSELNKLFITSYILYLWGDRRRNPSSWEGLLLLPFAKVKASTSRSRKKSRVFRSAVVVGSSFLPSEHQCRTHSKFIVKHLTILAVRFSATFETGAKNELSYLMELAVQTCYYWTEASSMVAVVVGDKYYILFT